MANTEVNPFSVALVGAAGSSVLVKDTPADEIWTMNHVAMLSEEGIEIHGELKYPFPKPVSLLMEIHNEHEIREPLLGKMADRYWTWLLNEHDFPIMVQDEKMLKLIPSAVMYPREDIKSLFKGKIIVGDEEKNEMFGSSIDYLFALALYRGYTDIYFYGATYGLETEYRYQLGGTHFWFGMANQMGVNLHFPPGDNFFEQKPYGFGAWVRINHKQLKKDRKVIKEKIHKTTGDEHERYQGAMFFIDYNLEQLDARKTMGREALELQRKDLERQLAGNVAIHNREMQQWSFKNVLRTEGALHMATNYVNMCDLMPSDLEIKVKVFKEQVDEQT